MYNAIRKIHLYAGLVIMLFLLMYFVTGYTMIHAKWFAGPAPAVETRNESLASFTGERTAEGIAAFVADKDAIHGRLILPPNPPQSGEPLKFSIFHPSLTCQVELAGGSDQLSLKITHNTIPQILTQLHRIHGYGGGWLFNVWALLNDLASFSCILFALTGVCLWWQSTRRRVWGWLCLGASCSYGLGMILYLLYAK